MVSNSPELWPATDSTTDATVGSSENAECMEPTAGTSETGISEIASSETSPESLPKKPSEPVKAGGKISKSQRIRDYLKAHPDARNRDVASDLEPFGVKPADVANVKTQLKQRSSSPKAAETVSEQYSPNAPGSVIKKTSKKTGRPKSSTAKKPTSRPTRTPAPTRATISGEVGLSEVEAAIQFIEQAGGIDRARQIIEMVDRIRSMNLG